MKADGPLAIALALAAILALPGCMATQDQLNAASAQNRALAEQNRAQLAEIENLKAHARDVENRCIRAEREMTSLQEPLVGSRRLPPSVSRQLADLSRRCPALNFDPATGDGKLDTDVLFDSGQAELKPAAQAMLAELGRVLQSPEAGDLKVMVVGHTDNVPLAGKSLRERYANNFHLSTARALAVADCLRRDGLSERRIGVAGFGPHEPVAANATAADRAKNRRVEIFVIAPDVPIVGWTDSVPSVY